MLFTFIMNYDGGTYISQVTGDTAHNAMRIWLERLDLTEVENFTERQRQRLIKEDFEDEKPVQIEGCANVWCFGLRISKRKELALIHFILTKVSTPEDRLQRSKTKGDKKQAIKPKRNESL